MPSKGKSPPTIAGAQQSIIQQADAQVGLALSNGTASQSLVQQTVAWRIVDTLPFPLEVYLADGTIILNNRALLEFFSWDGAAKESDGSSNSDDPSSPKATVYDKSSSVIAKLVRPNFETVLSGETVSLTDVLIPLGRTDGEGAAVEVDLSLAAVDMTIYPVKDDEEKVEYVVAHLIPRAIYKGLREIELAKRYLDEHWVEPYDASRTAQVPGLSKSHFIRLFKKNVGMTPHEYHTAIRIEHLKETLLDPDLSVAQAFSACGMNYSGYSARLFKKQTGLNPSEYRQKQRANL